mgnify:CR=1 FL=1
MAFQPGQSGNPKGRPVGSKDRTKRDLADRLAKFLSDDFDDGGEAGFMADWNELSPTNRMKTRAQLYEFVMKKLSRSETVVDVSRLTDAEIDELLDKIRDKYDGDDDDA